LARRVGGAAVACVLAEPVPATILAAHGADRVVAVVLPPDAATAEPRAAALAALIDSRRPHTVLFPASERGRDVAPRVAARLGLGLTGDCIGLTFDARGRLLQLKPALGTAVIAPIWSRTTPQLATVRPGSFAVPTADASRHAPVERTTPPVTAVRRSQLHASIVEVDPAWLPFDGAAAVVGVGTGIGGPEALPLVRAFAATFGAAIGATRRVTDRGWLPRQLQIGITGRIVAPDLYVAVGIRGAANHTIGIAGARTIVAVNPDPEAAIFTMANVGFVADFRALLEHATALL
jgi:electron transfer flavoprotein alpha subunit